MIDYKFTDIHSFKDSDFNFARLIVPSGFTTFSDDEETGFQDKSAVDQKSSVLFVIHWHDIMEPSYRVWKLDFTNFNIKVSKKIVGCCEELTFINDQVLVTTFRNVFWKEHGYSPTLVVKDFPYTLQELRAADYKLP